MPSPLIALKKVVAPRVSGTPIYGAAECRKLRSASRFNAELLDHLRAFVVPGITTAELDNIAYDYTIFHGHAPACLGYQGAAKRPYEHAICTSVNDVACHGVPDETVLRDGDLINIDATTIVDGYYGDSSETFVVGTCSREARELVRAAHDALFAGIRAVRPYGTVYEIGRAITALARRRGFAVVREYQGHGTGRAFHTEPGVPHFPYRSGLKRILRPGMCFTIEPILNNGTWRTVKDDENGWPVRTEDGSLSAQFEHTILLTENGPEILTKTRLGPWEGHEFRR